MPHSVRSGGTWLSLLTLLVVLATAPNAAADDKEPPKPEPPRREPARLTGLGGVAAAIRLLQQRQMQELARGLEMNQQRRLGRGPNAGTRGTLWLDGRLGTRLEQPGEAVIEQLDLPRGVGLVIGEVVSGSSAEKAGLKANDILLELDGKPVPSDPREFVKDLNGVKADMPIEAIVLRRGKRETVQGLSLPEGRAQALPANPNDSNVPRARVPLTLPGLLPGLGGPPNRRVPVAPLPLP